jgi:hypothetical protein
MQKSASGSWGLGVVFVLAHCAVTCGVAQETKPTVKAVGMNLGLADPDSEYGGSYVLGRSAGIEVTVMVEDKSSFFVSVIDEGQEKTELSLSADGQKLKNDSGFSRIGFMANISENGQRVVVPVSATQLPPRGTGNLKVSGNLVLLAGANEKTDKVTFKVAAGEQVQLGPVATKISSVDEYEFGETVTNITFETDQPLDVISGMKFFDEGGRALEASPGGSSSFGFGNQMTYSRSFQISGTPKSLSVEVRYFGSTKTVTIPIELDVDLSLSGK